jgi:hypothetical protein
MNMDRKVFKIPFNKNGVTKYQCPTCEKGVLNVKPEPFQEKETVESLKGHRHPEWDPEWIVYIYSCLFECTNTACKDVVSSSGTGSVAEDYSFDDDGMPSRDYFEYYNPQYFTPHLKVFKTPKGTPEVVESEINKSFSLLLCDPPSAANHIRVALEHLLTHLKVKRFTTTGGRRKFLNLHNRIDLLPSKFDNIKDIFFAVKWLGNAGSHSNHEVSLDDVLDSYELMIELLLEIFSNNRSKAKALAKKVNKKKGPK